MQSRQGPSVRSTIGVISLSNSSRCDLALVFLAVIFELDRGGGNEREPLFRLDHRAPQPLHALAVLRQILAPFARDVFERDAQQQIVDVVAAQVRVAVGGQNFEDPVVQFENRDVERAAAEIVHRNDAVLALVEPVGQRRGGRFIHQAQNFETRDASGVLGGLALGVVEVSRHRDDGLVHRHAEILLGILFQLAQHQRRNLGRRKGAIAKLELNHRFAAGRDSERKELQLVFDVLAARGPSGASRNKPCARAA